MDETFAKQEEIAQLQAWPDYVKVEVLGNCPNIEKFLRDKRRFDKALKIIRWEYNKCQIIKLDMFSKLYQEIITKRNNSNGWVSKYAREGNLEKIMVYITEHGTKNLPPIILIDNNGLEIWEGYHRCMAAFNVFPLQFEIDTYIGYMN